MLLLKNLSIKRRLTFIIMAVSSISVVLTTLVISAIGVVHMRENMVNEVGESAAIVGASNRAALNFDAYDKIPESLGVFSEYKIIIQACLYDVKTVTGENISLEVGHYVNQKKALNGNGQLQCPAELAEKTFFTDDHLAMMKPLYFQDQMIGYIYVDATLEPIDDYIHKQTSIAIVVGLAALLVSYLLAVWLQHGISRPILNLAETARKISKDKDYSVRAVQLGDADREHRNELVVLTDSFNVMISEISLRDQQLKKQNIALEKAKDDAEGANRAKSQFLANISHELRTPLNAVIGFSSILMNQLFGPLGDQKYWEYAKDINESGTHLLNIINDILDLSKAEAGKLDMNFEEVHIAKSINKCVTILSERAEKNQVSILIDIPKMLPPIVADRLRFIQILLNILSNAVKFTRSGGKVNIAVRTKENAGEITHFIVTVQDTGIGMSKSDVDKAFKSFGQVDSGLNRKYEGTGLGLPLTKKLMDLHHGIIEFDSELNKGTTVTLTFPALPPEGGDYYKE